MNGTSGFQEVRSSTSRSPSYRFLHGQRHQFGTGSWHHLRAYDFITLLSAISIKQAKLPGTISMQNIFTMRGSRMFIVSLLLIGASAGCSFITPPAKNEELNSNQSYWFHYEATRRAGFLVSTDREGKSNVKMCSEPPPDVALARTAEFILKGEYQGATGQAEAKLAEQLAQLGGRTETVLILRELLFRLCELSINSNMSSTELAPLYTSVVNAAFALADADHKIAEATLTKATSERIKAETKRMNTFNSLPPDLQKRFSDD